MWGEQYHMVSDRLVPTDNGTRTLGGQFDVIGFDPR